MTVMTNPYDTSLQGIIDNLQKRLSSLEQYSTSAAATSALPSSVSFDTVTIGSAVLNGINPNPVPAVTLTPGTLYEDTYLDVDITAPSDADFSTTYQITVAKKNVAAGTYSYGTVVNTNVLHTRVPGLQPNATYGVQVRAIDVLGFSSAPWPSTGYADITTPGDNTIPSTPTGLAAFGGIGTITASWSDVADINVAHGAGLYEWQIATNSTFTTGLIDNLVAGTVASQVVATGTSYWVRVRAITSSGMPGPWSSTATATTGSASGGASSDGSPPASSPFATLKPGYNTIFASWPAVANADTVTYEVHVSTASGFATGPTTKVGEVDGTLFTIRKDASGADLVPGTYYYVRIVARDRDGSATASGQAAGQVQSIQPGYLAVAALTPGGDLATGVVSGSQIAAGGVGSTALANGSVTPSKTAVAALDNVTGNLNSNTVNAAQLVAGAVGSAALAASAVTAAKTAIAAIDPSSGNLTANSVTSAQIVAGTIVASDIAAGTITGDRLLANTITATQIAADTITANEIAANAVTVNELAANSVNASKIVANSITATQILAGTITTNEIAANTITAADIAAGTITANEIAATTITAAKIATGTITATQVAAGTLTATQIQAGSITGDRLVAATITATQIQASTITGTQIAANSIQADKLTTGTLTSTTITLGTGGSFIAGAPAGGAGTGMIVDSTGIRFFNAGTPTLTALAGSGAVSMLGNLTSGSVITGATLTGGVIQTSANVGADRVYLDAAGLIVQREGSCNVLRCGNLFNPTVATYWTFGVPTGFARVASGFSRAGMDYAGATEVVYSGLEYYESFNKTGGTASTTDAYMYQDISAAVGTAPAPAAGQTWTASAYMATGGILQPYIYIQAFNGTTSLGTSPVVSNTAATNTWGRVSVTWTLPASTNKIRLVAGGPGNTTIAQSYAVGLPQLENKDHPTIWMGPFQPDNVAVTPTYGVYDSAAYRPLTNVFAAKPGQLVGNVLRGDLTGSLRTGVPNSTAFPSIQIGGFRDSRDGQIFFYPSRFQGESLPYAEGTINVSTTSATSGATTTSVVSSISLEPGAPTAADSQGRVIADNNGVSLYYFPRADGSSSAFLYVDYTGVSMSSLKVGSGAAGGANSVQVSRTTTSAISTSVWNNCGFQTYDYNVSDNGGMWDTTNQRVKCPVAGIYLVSGGVYVPQGVQATYTGVRILSAGGSEIGRVMGAYGNQTVSRSTYASAGYPGYNLQVYTTVGSAQLAANAAAGTNFFASTFLYV